MVKISETRKQQIRQQAHDHPSFKAMESAYENLVNTMNNYMAGELTTKQVREAYEAYNKSRASYADALVKGNVINKGEKKFALGEYQPHRQLLAQVKQEADVSKDVRAFQRALDIGERPDESHRENIIRFNDLCIMQESFAKKDSDPNALREIIGSQKIKNFDSLLGKFRVSDKIGDSKSRQKKYDQAIKKYEAHINREGPSDKAAIFSKRRELMERVLKLEDELQTPGVDKGSLQAEIQDIQQQARQLDADIRNMKKDSFFQSDTSHQNFKNAFAIGPRLLSVLREHYPEYPSGKQEAGVNLTSTGLHTYDEDQRAIVAKNPEHGKDFTLRGQNGELKPGDSPTNAQDRALLSKVDDIKSCFAETYHELNRNFEMHVSNSDALKRHIPEGCRLEFTTPGGDGPQQPTIRLVDADGDPAPMPKELRAAYDQYYQDNVQQVADKVFSKGSRRYVANFHTKVEPNPEHRHREALVANASAPLATSIPPPPGDGTIPRRSPTQPPSAQASSQTASEQASIDISPGAADESMSFDEQCDAASSQLDAIMKERDELVAAIRSIDSSKVVPGDGHAAMDAHDRAMQNIQNRLNQVVIDLRVSGGELDMTDAAIDSHPKFQQVEAKCQASIEKMNLGSRDDLRASRRSSSTQDAVSVQQQHRSAHSQQAEQPDQQEPDRQEPDASLEAASQRSNLGGGS